MANRLFLGVETATTNFSVALYSHKAKLDSIEINDGYSHAENIAVKTKELLARNKFEIENLSALCVGVGPGSYTGLRIGVSFIKGMAFKNSTPVIACSTLRTMFQMVLEENPTYKTDQFVFIPMLDARRMEVYAQVFDHNGQELNEIEAVVLDENSFNEYLDSGKSVVVFGNGAEKFVANFPHTSLKFIPNIFPCAEFMSAESVLKFENQNFEDVAYFEPFYLKDFVAAKPKRTLLSPE